MDRTLLLVLIGLTACSAQTEGLDDLVDNEGEERTIFTSGGTYYLALNTTFLVYYTLAAGFLVLGAIILTSLFDTAEARSDNGYSQGHQRGAPHEGAHQRQRRGAYDNVASQLVLLAEAFKKYEVNEDGCQLYVACNSSKLAGKGNTLEKITHGVLSLVAEPGNEYLYNNDKYLQDMVTAFKTGPRGTCDTFRKLCRRKFH